MKSRARTNASHTNSIIPLPRHGKAEVPFRRKHAPRWPHPIQIVPFSPGVAKSRGISSRSRKSVPTVTRYLTDSHLLHYRQSPVTLPTVTSCITDSHQLTYRQSLLVATAMTSESGLKAMHPGAVFGWLTVCIWRTRNTPAAETNNEQKTTSTKL